MKEEKKKKGLFAKLKKWGKPSAAVLASGMLISAVFSTPAELLQPQQPPAPVSIVAVQAPSASSQGDELSTEKKRTPADRVRAAILRLPLAVRALVGLPLWGIGWAALWALSALWSSISSALGGAVLGWVCFALVLALVFGVSAKTMFPSLPLRKIFSKRTILPLLAGTALLGGADTALSFLLKDYSAAASRMLRLGGGAVFLAGLLGDLWLRCRKEKQDARLHQSSRCTQDLAGLAPI